jgi:hypothetical protein
MAHEDARSAAARALAEYIGALSGKSHSEADIEQAANVIDLIGDAVRETPHARAVAAGRKKR